MKVNTLLDRLVGINNLVKDLKNKKLKDLEYEIEHVIDKFEIVIKDVDDFGVEEDIINDIS